MSAMDSAATVDAAGRFTVPGDDIERLYYGFSILHCLPIENDFYRFYRLIS